MSLQDNPPRPVDALLARYAASRRDPANCRIHLACAPVIGWSLLGILWSLHPVLALAGCGGALWYYERLSRPFALGLLAAAAVLLALLALMPPLTVAPLSIALLFLAWSAQFIGNKMEGNTASFRAELRLLPGAPLFMLARLYRRFGIAW